MFVFVLCVCVVVLFMCVCAHMSCRCRCRCFVSNDCCVAIRHLCCKSVFCVVFGLVVIVGSVTGTCVL